MAKTRPALVLQLFDTLDTLPRPVSDDDGTLRYADVEFGTSIGFRPVRMDIMIPAAAALPVPVVIYIHGGAFRFGSRRHGPVSGPIWQSLLQRGMAVAAVEYRLSGEAPFPACLHDVKAAVRWLRRFGPGIGLRPDAIGSWGESAGAHLAAFLGLNSSDEALNGSTGVTEVPAEVQAAVAWYPPTDFLTMDEQAPAGSAMSHDAADSPESVLIRGPLQEHPDRARFASPLSHVSAAAAPVLLIHGREDRLVPCRQSVVLAEALRAAGADVILELVPDADHVFWGVDVAPIVARSADYLAGHLL
jgi:acetyl esterase/lipase